MVWRFPPSFYFTCRLSDKLQGAIDGWHGTPGSDTAPCFQTPLTATGRGGNGRGVKRSSTGAPSTHPLPDGTECMTPDTMKTTLFGANDVRDPDTLRGSSTVSPITKLLAVARAYKEGYQPNKRSKKKPLDVAGIFAAYVNGYRSPFSASQVLEYIKQARGGREAVQPKSKSNNERLFDRFTNKGTKLTREELMHEYRLIEAEQDNLTFEEITQKLNEKLGVGMSTTCFTVFFREQGGKEYADTTCPYLTPENVEDRLVHARLRQELAARGNLLEFHLDEK